MKSILARRIVPVALALILIISSVVVGCGGGSEETHEVVIGFLGDQTGPSAEAFRAILESYQDYITVMEAENPIPGVKVRVVPYDTRYEYARVPMGYEYLVEKGMVLLMQYMQDQQPITLDSQIGDSIPSLAFNEKEGMENQSWVFAHVPKSYYEGTWVMDYILRSWDYAKMGRPVEVGHLTMAGYPADQQQHQGMQDVADANPGKCRLTLTQGEPTTTAWATEVNQLKDCDYIVSSSVGPASPTFLKEARQRGYTGPMIFFSQSLLGYWSAVKSAVPAEYLDGVMVPHAYLHWTDDVEYIDQIKQRVAQYFPSKADRLQEGTAWLSQQLLAQVVTEAVRRAAADVGPANIDGAAMRDALEATDITIEGMGETISCHGGVHVLYRMYRMIQYDSAADEWAANSDWTLPFGLTA